MADSAPTVDPVADEATARRATERQLGFARLAAVVIGVVQLLLRDLDGPTWTVVAAWLGLGLLSTAGVVALWLVPSRRLGAAWGERAAWLETVGLATLLPAAPDEHTAFVVLALLLMAVLGGLRDGRRGVHRALAVGVAAEAVRTGTALVVFEHAHLEDSLTAVGLAAAVGLVVGHVSDLSRHRAARATATTRQLEIQHRVVLAGIGGRLEDALQRMADTLADVLHSGSVTVVLTDDEGPVVAATTDPAITPRTRPQLITDGSLDRTLRHGMVCIASDRELELLEAVLPRRGSVSTAPLRRAGVVCGALCVDTPPGVVLDDVDRTVVGRLADQMSLVIEAARALDHEARLAARYRDLDRMKTDFVAVTSHELRTPLTAIAGGVMTLQERWPDMPEATKLEMLTLIRRQTDRLRRLTDDLRTVSALDAGSLTVATRPVRVAPLLETAVGATGHRDRVRLQGGDVAVLADPDRFEQIVVNLVRNAFDHGASTAEVTWSSAGADVVVVVADDGPGIPAAHREHVFERFYQVGDADQHAQGTGLGLSIARELAERMGGALVLAPGTAAGATFHLRLPRGEPSALPSPVGRVTAATSGGVEP